MSTDLMLTVLVVAAALPWVFPSIFPSSRDYEKAKRADQEKAGAFHLDGTPRA